MEDASSKPSSPPPVRIFSHQISVFLLTFAAYASFHASRKPPSIVKSVLGSDADSPDDTSGSSAAGWAPFDGRQGPHRLGELDLAFLAAYSLGMFFAGHVGDRLNLRRFLAFGMFGSGLTTAIFGLAYWLDIHKMGFFLGIQVLSGVFQSIGWPCVIAVVGNWFDKSKRGLIMGFWNSNTSFGNILGSVIAAAVLEYGWGWSFVLPGMIIILVGCFVWRFLLASPEELGIGEKPVDIEMVNSGGGDDVPTENGGDDVPTEIPDNINGEEVGLLGSQASEGEVRIDSAIGFMEAWKLPGVASYAFCLFFSKLVAYTFLYWLPFYIQHTAIAGKRLSHKASGILSTIFDVGGIFGGISAGYISDNLEARAVTSIFFLVLSIPALILYRSFGGVSHSLNITLMFFSGYFVNGPYALITTAVSADLGTQDAIKGNSRALATVTAIIDGTGSIGAALGPLLTGYISTRGWNAVFVMLVLATSLASLFLIHLAKAEIAAKMLERK